MLKVKTYVGVSKIHGKGCKAAIPIKKDEIVWIYDPEETFERKIDYLERFGWFDGVVDMYVYPMDNARYINHSEDPNLYADKEVMRAKRDINADEELTENYEEYMNSSDIQKHLGDRKKKEKTM